MWIIKNRKSKQFQKYEAQSLLEFNPAYQIIGNIKPKLPLILSVPHSGRIYPNSFLSQSRLDLKTLRQSEDHYVDQLIAPLAKYGFSQIHALYPRIFLDPNRAPDELPPEFCQNQPITPQARFGHGVIPMRVGGVHEIYKYRMTQSIIQSRLDRLYRPYHQKLQELLTNSLQRFGFVVLLDIHSMPATAISGQKRSDIVIGDNYGQSAKSELCQATVEIFTKLGFITSLNNPYAGGFITRHYGQVEKNQQALQIEINKELYLKRGSYETHSGFKELQDKLQKAVLEINDYISFQKSEAAE